MELNQYTKNNPVLRGILQQSRYFLALDTQVKKLLPPNLHAHFHVACVKDGALIITANNAMVASRLKMMIPAFLLPIQELGDNIQRVEIKMLPENPIPQREKRCHLNENVLAMFEHTAEQVAHHPKLAQTLRDLVNHHR